MEVKNCRYLLFYQISSLAHCDKKSKETPGVGAKPAAMSGERFFFFFLILAH